MGVFFSIAVVERRNDERFRQMIETISISSSKKIMYSILPLLYP